MARQDNFFSYLPDGTLGSSRYFSDDCSDEVGNRSPSTGWSGSGGPRRSSQPQTLPCISSKDRDVSFWCWVPAKQVQSFGGKKAAAAFPVADSENRFAYYHGDDAFRSQLCMFMIHQKNYVCICMHVCIMIHMAEKLWVLTLQRVIN